MTWRKHSAVELNLSALKTRTEIEREFWSEYALSGQFPRHIPEWIPDSTISNALWKLVATEYLPWEFQPGEFEERFCHERDDDDE